jgi:hypothetical protein
MAGLAGQQALLQGFVPSRCENARAGLRKYDRKLLPSIRPGALLEKNSPMDRHYRR